MSQSFRCAFEQTMNTDSCVNRRTKHIRKNVSGVRNLIPRNDNARMSASIRTFSGQSKEFVGHNGNGDKRSLSPPRAHRAHHTPYTTFRNTSHSNKSLPPLEDNHRLLTLNPNKTMATTTITIAHKFSHLPTRAQLHPDPLGKMVSPLPSPILPRPHPT